MSTPILKEVSGSACRFPKRLKAGDRIGIVASSGTVDEAQAAAGVRVLEEMGFSVVVPQGIFHRKRYLAGGDRHRADGVVRMFADSRIDGVFCARGGYGAMRTLMHIDWRVMRENPKPLVGFSDATALLTAYVERCRTVAYHGPMLTQLPAADEATLAGLKAALMGEEPLRLAAAQAEIVRPGRATGRICGGNLATLCHLAGTLFAPKWSGGLVFLEDCNEASYRIDRMLSQLKLGGMFDGAAGVFFGSFTDCGPSEEIFDIFYEIAGDLHIPILGGFEIGHGSTNLTLPLGAQAVLDTRTASLTVPLAAAD